MTRGMGSRSGHAAKPVEQPRNLSSADLTPTGSEDLLRDRIFGLLQESAVQGLQGTAALELTALVRELGEAGDSARALLVEELLCFEESILASMTRGVSANEHFRFAEHILKFLSDSCGEGASPSRRQRLLACTEGYLHIANSEQGWSAGATRLLAHVATLADHLFAGVQEPSTILSERKALGKMLLTFLSSHQGLFTTPELCTELATELARIVQTVVELDTPKRGETLKVFFNRVNRVCAQFRGDGEIDDILLGEPTELIGELLDQHFEQNWSEDSDAYEEALERQNKPDGAPESDCGDGPKTQPPEDGDTDPSYVVYEDKDGQAELESWQVGMENATESAFRTLKSLLARALRDSPSLQRDEDLWRRLAFEESAYEPGTSFFVQGFAQTSSKAVESLIVALPLSVAMDEIFLVNFVALLDFEGALTNLHGVDLVQAYNNATHSLAEDADFLELEDEYGEDLRVKNGCSIQELVDDTIRSTLQHYMRADLSTLAELSELGIDEHHMRSLIQGFVERVWGTEAASDAKREQN